MFVYMEGYPFPHPISYLDVVGDDYEDIATVVNVF